MMVTLGKHKGKRLYNLHLSRQNFEHLDAGCPDVDRLIGRSPGGYDISIFPGDSMPTEFHDSGEMYYANMGAQISAITDMTKFDELSNKASADLEQAIRESDFLPINNEFGLMGYVKMYLDE